VRALLFHANESGRYCERPYRCVDDVTQEHNVVAAGCASPL
jgi:hypothetical protein